MELDALQEAHEVVELDALQEAHEVVELDALQEVSQETDKSDEDELLLTHLDELDESLSESQLEV